jgi:hypothetical protein
VNRPKLNISIKPEDFKNFYWLKTELVSFCRANGISATGGKIEIAGRIEHYLAMGKVIQTSRKPSPTSSFDWKNAELNLSTKLTDNYKNTENVRAFMILHIGPHFRFNTQFMIWAKAHTGKSLREAIEEWNHIYTRKKNKEYQSEIAPQFEYNMYIRDFLADNLGMATKDAIKYWKLKRAQRGNKKYSKQDLRLF